MSHYGIIAIISSLLWNHAPSYSSVELLPIQLSLCHLPLSIIPDVCAMSQLKRCSYVSFRELILSARSSRRSIPVGFSFLSVVIMLDAVLRARRRDKDGDWINTFMKCNLDREVCVSFVSPLSSYLTSWISGRDSCLVGVSCHSPRIWLQIVALHPCIMFKFKKVELRKFQSLKILIKRRANNPGKCIQCFKNALQWCLIFLAKVLVQTKNMEHFWGIILAIWI